MKRLAAWLLSMAVGCFSASLADAATVSFDDANRLYEQGKFAEAARAYEELLQQEGSSAGLHFNAGNARFKTEQIGQAIVHYRLAERLAPRDPDIQANLRFARESAGGNPAGQHWLSRWLNRLSLNEWSTLAAAGLWAWLVLAVLGLLRPDKRPALRGTTRTIALACLVASFGLGFACKERFAVKSAVVVTAEAVARFGPLEESESHFNLRDGAEVIVKDVKDGWLQVTDGQGRSGWIQEKQARIIE